MGLDSSLKTQVLACYCLNIDTVIGLISVSKLGYPSFPDLVVNIMSGNWFLSCLQDNFILRSSHEGGGGNWSNPLPRNTYITNLTFLLEKFV